MQYPTYHEYDAMGRKVKTIYPDGGVVAVHYGSTGSALTEKITDQEGGVKWIARDTRGNIVAVTEYADEQVATNYRYDALNQITSVIDAKGNVTTIGYDALGRRISIDNPDAGRTEFWYDDAGNLIGKQTAKHRAKNQYIRYTYHFHQLKMIDNPESDDVYFDYGLPGAPYHGAGRVVKERTGTLVDEYGYGALGEVVKRVRTIEGKKYSIVYRWDNFGRQRSVSYSNGFTVSYAYDSGGQVKAVTGFMGGNPVEYITSVHYDPFGSRTKVEYGNGVITTYTYDDAMHRLIGLQTKQGESIYQNIAYAYDKVGNILTRIENGVVMSDGKQKTIAHRYRYDPLYRLTEAEGSIKEEGNTVHSYTNTFTYSPIGNIMSKLQTVKVKGEQDPNLTYNYNYTYAGTRPHAVTNINDNLTYRYDANGNMIAFYDTAKNFQRVLFWDDENRLTKTVDTTNGGSVATSYAYDTKGMRIIKDGPYGKTIYVDTGFVLSNDSVVSNHVFMGNTRIASIVKHKDEANPATYYFASEGACTSLGY
jgi:YD repeat-containing protein